MEARFNMETLLENLSSLPTLPEVALKVLHLTSDSESDVNDLNAVISNDPALTSKILRVANSSFYGFRSKISTLKMAIVVLGFDETARLVRAFTFLQAFPADRTGDRFDYNRFWLHSIAVSEVVKGLCLRLGIDEAGDLSTAGLLHDIGRIVLASYFEDSFVEVVNEASAQGLPWHQVELDLMGIDHAQIGEILAKRWSLPESLQTLIRYHHEPGEAPSLRWQSSLLYMANRITGVHDAKFDQPTTSAELAEDPEWEVLLEQSRRDRTSSPSELIDAASEDVERARDFHRQSLG